MKRQTHFNTSCLWEHYTLKHQSIRQLFVLKGKKLFLATEYPVSLYPISLVQVVFIMYFYRRYTMGLAFCFFRTMKYVHYTMHAI